MQDATFVGGNGGGVIRLFIRNELSINGSISANGDDGMNCCAKNIHGTSLCDIGGELCIADVISGISLAPAYGGGGSGGTVLLKMQHRDGLQGVGHLQAKGGAGSHYDSTAQPFEPVQGAAGGGGGAGGCMESWWESLNTTANEAYIVSSVDINASGGNAGCHDAACLSDNGEIGSFASLSCPPGAGGFMCQVCGAGSQPTNTSSDYKCDKCEPGTFSDKKGDDMCAPCAMGTNVSTKGAQVCDACPVGHFAAKEGSATCSPCCCDTQCSTTLNQYGIPCCPKYPTKCTAGQDSNCDWPGIPQWPHIHACLRHRYPRTPDDGTPRIGMASQSKCWDEGVFACEPGFIAFGGDGRSDCWDPSQQLNKFFKLPGGTSRYVGLCIVAFIFVGAGIMLSLLPLMLLRACRALQRRREQNKVPLQSMRFNNGDRHESISELNLRRMNSMHGSRGEKGALLDQIDRSGGVGVGSGMMARLTDGDITKLIDRVYLGGTNSWSSPWQCPMGAPSKLLPHFGHALSSPGKMALSQSSGWRSFAKRCNSAVGWTSWGQERVVYVHPSFLPQVVRVYVCSL